VKISRRVLSASPLLALTALPENVLSQTPATPEGTPESLTPEEVLEALLAAPFQSPLLPADTGEVVVTEWVDDSDTDLDGAVGGILFGAAAAGAEFSIGAMIVHFDPQTATERITSVAADTSDPNTVTDVKIAGYSGATVILPSDETSHPVNPGYATTAVAAGFVIISGGAEDLPNAELETRSLAHTLALIDHLRRVTAE
jgi:hypothetical protein